MRPIVAVGILLIGLHGGAPERDQEPRRVAGEHSFAFLRNAPWMGKAEREAVLAVPPAQWSDRAHQQAEEAMAPAQLPAAASDRLDADEAASQSVGELCQALLTSAEDNGLPVTFFANLIWQESRLRHDAVSPVGALGIAQFMPQAALEAGVGDPFDPRQAIPASARLLHVLREHFGNLGFAAAAYNAGAHRVSEWLDHRRPLPREARNYVERITGRSVEAWRKTPLADAKLTFARSLPCRELPAYADLEHTRREQARLLEQVEKLQQAQTRQEAALHQVAQAIKQKVRLGQKVPHPQKVAQKTAVQSMRKKSAGTHVVVAAPLHGRAAGYATASGIIARNFHSKHNAAHRPHAPHEKRRIAQQQSALLRC